MFDSVVKRGTLLTVIVLIICIMGVLAAVRIPIQMIPDLEVRTITIETSWAGATPQDIEKDIIIEQEKYLRSIPSLQRIISTSSFGSAEIELEFPFGINLNETLININNALSQVPNYPVNVDEPRIFASSFSSNSFMYFHISPLGGNPEKVDMALMQDFIEDHVRTRMETIPGVSQVDVFGGAERQLQILLNPGRLVKRGITITDVRDAILERNRDISGGEIDGGKRRYLLRTVGRFEDLDDLRKLIISRRGDSIIRLQDVAEVKLDHFEQNRIAFTDGYPVIGLSVRRLAGSNVVNIKNELLKALPQINEDILNPAGLYMRLIADDVSYVESSIKNVWSNLLLGALLATIVMYWFLRSSTTTLVAVVGIPICSIAAFIGLILAGRTINVISLAGVAFAIGMTLDNSIVVLENIQRLREQGLGKIKSAVQGVQEVWPAVLASTMTTVLVFIPIIFIKEEAGQLYSDVAIAISACILASMLVAITVIPAAASKLKTKPARQANNKLRDTLIQNINWLINTNTRCISVVIITAIIAILIVMLLTPPAEYLPEGEEPKTFATLSSPPGYNIETMTKIGLDIQEYFLPFIEHSPEQFNQGITNVPALAYLFLNIEPQRIRIITQPKDPSHIKDLMKAIEQKYQQYPAMRAFVTRGSIITSNSGGTRSINVDISGPDLEQIYTAALAVYQRAEAVFDSARIGAEPSTLSLSQPLIEVRPNWERSSELGMTAEDIGYAVASLTDGAYVDEFYIENDKVDIFLLSHEDAKKTPDSLGQIPIYTPISAIVPLSNIAEIVETVDTNIIRRVNSQRTVTLNIIPPDDIALETGVEIVKKEVVNYLRKSSALDKKINMTISGASDQLDATREALTANYMVAIIIIYLLLVAIFTHWGYPLLIMTTIPIGVAGGIFGLWLFNQAGNMLPIIGMSSFHLSFDMITMLGFLILMGTVVNNPILIVHQAIINQKIHGMDSMDAVKNAVAMRIRPIAMSTFTTVFGLAPLVFLSGDGAELYRGVGVIVMFGLLSTALVSLTFLPALTTFVLKYSCK